MILSKRNVYKKIAARLMTFAFVLLTLLTGPCIFSRAAEGEQLSGELITLSEDAGAYALPSETSEIVKEFKAGDVVLKTNDTPNYIEIYYQDQTLYISKKNLSVEASANEALAAEMEKQSQIDKSWIESYVSQMKAIRNARIWRAVIIILIVAVVGVIIFKSVTHKEGS